MNNTSVSQAYHHHFIYLTVYPSKLLQTNYIEIHVIFYFFNFILHKKVHDFVLSATFVNLQNVPGKKGKNDLGVFICIKMWGNFREKKMPREFGIA